MKMLTSASSFIGCACYSKNIMFVFIESQAYEIFPDKLSFPGFPEQVNPEKRSHITMFLFPEKRELRTIQALG
ncbi:MULTISPECIES: hypothetical protein [Methanosarcina]|uniref:hypothetical protein n=1 Tax=Methanosarcina TaxID=2207 RepID=UPI00064F89AC|nr:MULTISPECIES: hypothetical protein [Methanosarcina]MCC4767699.1 hypothetical protein [Methanosarcina sp. DH1]